MSTLQIRKSLRGQKRKGHNNLTERFHGVGVVQIAAPIAGCIETYVKLGDTVSPGQPIGRIALGSQVHLLIPRNASEGLMLSVESRAKAGETTSLPSIESQRKMPPIVFLS